jgi:hypothetical protein
VNLARYLISKIPANWPDITLGALAPGRSGTAPLAIARINWPDCDRGDLAGPQRNFSEGQIDGYSWRYIRRLKGVTDSGINSEASSWMLLSPRKIDVRRKQEAFARACESDQSVDRPGFKLLEHGHGKRNWGCE